MSHNISQPIASTSEAKTFIDTLIEHGMMWHFEDSPDEALAHMDLTRAQLAHLKMRVNECYMVPWGALECPLGYAITKLNGADQ